MFQKDLFQKGCFKFIGIISRSLVNPCRLKFLSFDTTWLVYYIHCIVLRFGMQGLAVQDPKRTSTYQDKFPATAFQQIAGKGYDGVRSAK